MPHRARSYDAGTATTSRRFDEFASRYRAELSRPPACVALEHLVELARTQKIVLLTATRDVEHSGARVLEERTARAARG